MLPLTAVLLAFRVVYCLKFCDSPNNSLLRVIGGSTTTSGNPPIGYVYAVYLHPFPYLAVVACTSFKLTISGETECLNTSTQSFEACLYSSRNYPWQAAVVFYDGYSRAQMCGATVVEEYWVLTAAHCTMNNWKKGYILTGLERLNDSKHTVHVERTVVHPSYDGNQIANDIALVKSTHTLLKSGISTICVTKNDSRLLSSSDKAFVTGFGLHIVSQSPNDLTMGVSNTVLKTTVPLIPIKQCRLEWSVLSGGGITISDSQLCAGSRLHGTAPGDSGSPLLVTDGAGRTIQVGITSFGADGLRGLLDQGNFPGVYTRVSAYVPWMEEVVNCGAGPSCFFILYYFLIFSK